MSKNPEGTRGQAAAASETGDGQTTQDAPPVLASRSASEMIENLRKMRDAGLLTDREFAALSRHRHAPR